MSNHLFRTRNDSRLSYFILIGIIIFIHGLSFIAFGSTYWYDSIAYFDLSYHIFEGGGIAAFYAGPGYYLYQHLSVGPSLMWGSFNSLFGRNTWSVYALIQHGIAIISLFYFLVSCRKYLRIWVLLPIAVSLTLHPFYESLHNAVMTESVASSMLMFLAGAALNLLSEKDKIGHHLAIFVISGIIGIQFRVYLVLMAMALLLGIILFKNWRQWFIFLIAAVLICSSVFYFPIIRWVATGKYFLANGDCISATIALWSNTSQSKRVENILEAQDFPPGINPKEVVAKGMSYEQSVLWASHLAKKGLTDQQIRQTISRVAWRIRLDNWQNISSQIDSALAGIGVLSVSLFHKRNGLLSEGMTTGEWRSHNRRHLKWLSWTSGNDYNAALNHFVNMYKTSNWYHRAAIDRMYDAIHSNLSTFKLSRDVLMLSKIGLDVWVFGWIFGVIILIKRSEKELVLILGTPPLINYISMLMIGFGNIRYSYILLPFYFTATWIGMIYASKYVIIKSLAYRSSIRNRSGKGRILC
jgi:hypothetical protein